MYFDDFLVVITTKCSPALQVIGSPANPVARLSAWNIYQGRQVLPVNGSRWIPAATWSVIHQEVLKQCDGIDGVSTACQDYACRI